MPHIPTTKLDKAWFEWVVPILYRKYKEMFVGGSTMWCLSLIFIPPGCFSRTNRKAVLVRAKYCQISDISRALAGNKFWSVRCNWSIACRRCSNYIFILDSTSGFNGLGKDNCKARRETFHFLFDSVYVTYLTIALQDMDTIALTVMIRMIIILNCFLTCLGLAN